MESLGDRYKRLHLLCLSLIILAALWPPETTLGFNELWNQADMIVEGRITDLNIQDGQEVGTIEVRAVIKPVGSSTLYTKGLDFEDQVQVRSQGVDVDSYQRLYLEKVGKSDYRVIKIEKIPEPEASVNIGAMGLTALISITAVAYLVNRK